MADTVFSIKFKDLSEDNIRNELLKMDLSNEGTFEEIQVRLKEALEHSGKNINEIVFEEYKKDDKNEDTITIRLDAEEEKILDEEPVKTDENIITQTEKEPGKRQELCEDGKEDAFIVNVDDASQNDLDNDLQNSDTVINNKMNPLKGDENAVINETAKEKQCKHEEIEQKNNNIRGINSENSSDTKHKENDAISEQFSEKKVLKLRKDKLLLVRNLSSSISAFDLQVLFSKFGRVLNSKILMKKGKDGSEFYGLITMVNETEAEIALKELNNKEFKGANLNISEADPKFSNIASSCNTPQTKHDSVGEKSKTIELKKNKKNISPSKVGNINKLEQEKHLKEETRKRVARKRQLEQVRREEAERKRLRIRRQQALQEERERARKRERIEQRQRLEIQRERQRQYEIQKIQREEAQKLERERERLRAERERFEREKIEMQRAERERIKMERERLERERQLERDREQFRQMQHQIEEQKHGHKRNLDGNHRNSRDNWESKRRLESRDVPEPRRSKRSPPSANISRRHGASNDNSWWSEHEKGVNNNRNHTTVSGSSTSNQWGIGNMPNNNANVASILMGLAAKHQQAHGNSDSRYDNYKMSQRRY